MPERRKPEKKRYRERDFWLHNPLESIQIDIKPPFRSRLTKAGLFLCSFSREGVSIETPWNNLGAAEHPLTIHSTPTFKGGRWFRTWRKTLGAAEYPLTIHSTPTFKGGRWFRTWRKTLGAAEYPLTIHSTPTFKGGRWFRTWRKTLGAAEYPLTIHSTPTFEGGRCFRTWWKTLGAAEHPLTIHSYPFRGNVNPNYNTCGGRIFTGKILIILKVVGLVV
jgi:hypothetical protein